MAGMKNLLIKLRLALAAWLRQPIDEMDRKQTKSDVQSIFPTKDNSN
jgi:hypothetical protein